MESGASPLTVKGGRTGFGLFILNLYYKYTAVSTRIKVIYFYSKNIFLKYVTD